MTQIPLADGGPGFLEVLHANLGGQFHPVQVQDPLGRPVDAQWLEHNGTAYIEAAQANGLALLAPEERDPCGTSSFGVGELIAAAAMPQIVVGLGGSATNDGGRGVRSARRTAVDGLLLATDVDSPLLGPHGATYGFAPQKGARPEQLPALEQHAGLGAARPELAQAPGAGAAGGLGFGLMLLGGTSGVGH